MNTLIVVSILEAVYVVYMLRYFKTRYSFAHPLVKFKAEFLRHPIGTSPKPVSNICPFGHMGAILIAIAIFIRLTISINRIFPRNIVKMYSRMAVFMIFIFSLMNMNAVLYLTPFFISETLLIRKLL